MPKKTILITGSTDGLGLLTAKTLAKQGHTILLHGRSLSKLDSAKAQLGDGTIGFIADLSHLSQVDGLANEISSEHDRIDVLINNAGVLSAPSSRTKDGLDIRFAVNTLAPYILAKKLLPLIPKDGRIINVTSASQAPIDMDLLKGKKEVANTDETGSYEAYEQSKLAILIWSQSMAKDLPDGPVIVPVNPGSYLASKMVTEHGIEGQPLQVGADILTRASLDDEFASASGKYYDNDAKCFNEAHEASRDEEHCTLLMKSIEEITKVFLGK